MKHLTGLLMACLILSACEKKHNQGATLSGKETAYDSCTFLVPVNYSGATAAGSCANGSSTCTYHHQTITVQSDVVNHPLDQVHVSLCKADGTCIELGSPYIALATHQVQLVNAFEDGYTTYNINEVLCQ